MQAVDLVFFAHNRQDAAVVRRIKEFQSVGWHVSAFTFRRDGDDGTTQSGWDNHDLGYVEHGRFAARIFRAARSFKALWQHIASVRRARVIYARNLDMALIALSAQFLAGRSKCEQRVIYECLDVHEALTRKGVKATILRFLERCVLRKADLLVYSSSGFMTHYFQPVQRYKGPSVLVENKLFFFAEELARPEFEREAPATDSRRLTISWVGIIRCRRTLELLCEVAEQLPHRLEIRIHGKVSYFLLPDFDDKIAQYPNVSFRGAYSWPRGLTAAYEGVDLSWSQELSWQGHNSDWLIPNRVYEASYLGVPSIALAGTETGRFVAERQVGYVLEQATPQALADFLINLNIDQLQNTKEGLLSRPARDFVHDSTDANMLAEAVLGCLPEGKDA